MRIFFKDKVRGQGRERSCQRGFTLIELIVVMAIIAILAGLTMPALRLARIRAREASARAMIASLGMALSMYETDFGVYPLQLPGVDVNNSSNNVAIVDLLADDRPIAHGNNDNWHGPYIDFNEDDLTASIALGGQVKDPWGQPYFYGTRNLGLYGSPPAGRGFFIYSSGPDKDNNDGGGDDINNW